MTWSGHPSFSCAAVPFDLDGVLVDSAACVQRTWRQWVTQHQLDPDRVIALAHGRRTLDTIQLVAAHLVATAEAAALEASESRTTEGVFEVPGARVLLEGLPGRRWAIVTSGIRAVATLGLRHTRLPIPDVLVCADEIERRKPDPQGYLAAAARLGVAPAECVVIEDAPAGLAAAHAAGMRAIGVAGTYPTAALRSADYVVSRLAALRIRHEPRRDELEVALAALGKA